jgi:crotonobetainyl-CoA:carnitine CoA-transferase CaiB-like acyl-CoA transferase
MPPLAGLHVLDFSTLLPGPLATLLLAEAGARVTKVERPQAGEEMRHYPPRFGALGAPYALLNRGKRVVALDLKDATDRAEVMRLVAEADVLVEQFRPGVMARLGLDAGRLQAVNPRLVYCSITGYGQTGPKRDKAGHDLNYIAESGLLGLSFGPADRPAVPPALVADIAGGAYPAVLNILLALAAREKTGKGAVLDVAMADNLYPFAFWALAQGFAGGRWPGNATDLLNGGTARYRIYQAGCGRHLAVAAIEEKFWATFCDVIGLGEALRPMAVAQDKVAAVVAALLATRSAADWMAAFAGKDACVSLVASLDEAVADPHVVARRLFAASVSDGAGAVMPALPVPVASCFRAAPESEAPAPALPCR